MRGEKNGQKKEGLDPAITIEVSNRPRAWILVPD